MWTLNGYLLSVGKGQADGLLNIILILPIGQADTESIFTVCWKGSGRWTIEYYPDATDESG